MKTLIVLTTSIFVKSGYYHNQKMIGATCTCVAELKKLCSLTTLNIDGRELPFAVSTDLKRNPVSGTIKVVCVKRKNG